MSPWFSDQAELLEAELRDWLDDDDATSVVQKIIADGWRPPMPDGQEDPCQS